MAMRNRMPQSSQSSQSSGSLNAAYGSDNYAYDDPYAQQRTGYSQPTAAGSSYTNEHNSSSTGSASSRSMSSTNGAINNPYSSNGKGKSKSSSSNPMLVILPWILSLVFFAFLLFCRHQTNTLRDEMKQMQTDHTATLESCETGSNELRSAMRENSRKLSRLEREKSTLERDKVNVERVVKQKDFELNQKESLLSKSREVQDSSEGTIEKYKSRDSALLDRIDLLTEKIERESYRDALEKFGPGPHLVTIEVELPIDAEQDASLPEGEFPSFVIQMHSLKAMPHAVHLFLEQVHHRLWDNNHFVVNAPHILQAGAIPGEQGRANPVKRFIDAGLDVVYFQEYNEEHPHNAWTVGFAGRPGGPDFYINKINNVKNHGPGGQEHHDLQEEADPCIGEVVEGKEVVERMFANPVKNKKQFVLEKPIRIVKARIVGRKDAEDVREIPKLHHRNLQHEQRQDIKQEAEQVPPREA